MTLHPHSNEPEEPPPSEDELLAMAYADGELGAEDAAAFTARLRAEPALLRLVAEHRALEVLSRQVGHPEPAEVDWANLKADRIHRGTTTAGWVLIVLAALLGASMASGAFLLDESVPVAARALAGAGVLGVALLFSSVLRRRMRALPLDPYRHVQR